MFNAIATKVWCKLSVQLTKENAITAIEYAIIGVAMSSALFFIFDKGNFLNTLSAAWGTMGNNITSSGNILKTP